MDRRRLLLTGAALAAAPAAGVSAPHDPILRMIEDAEKLHSAWLATPEHTPEQIKHGDAMFDQYCDLRDRALRQTAQSVDGFKAQLRYVAIDLAPDYCEDRMILRGLASLLRGSEVLG